MPACFPPSSLHLHAWLLLTKIRPFYAWLLLSIKEGVSSFTLPEKETRQQNFNPPLLNFFDQIQSLQQLGISATFNADELAPFFGFFVAAAALVFSFTYGGGLWNGEEWCRVTSMEVMRPELVMKSIVLVVVAGVLGIYGLIIAVIIITGINPKAKSYYLFEEYAYLSSGLACGLTALSAGMTHWNRRRCWCQVVHSSMIMEKLLT